MSILVLILMDLHILSVLIVDFIMLDCWFDIHFPFVPLFPPSLQVTQTCSLIHALNFITTSYCLALDAFICYRQCSILDRHEAAVRQTVIQHIQARIPHNLYFEFKQLSAMDSVSVNAVYLKLSQESDRLMDRANTLSLLVNGRIIFDERVGR